MKVIKAIHFADVHYSRENKEKALLSLETVCEKGEKEAVDLFILSGDLFDRPVNDSTSSGFPALVKVIQRMMNIAPVVAVYGTPTHDTPGCYEAFQEIEAEHNFTILQPGKAYFLDSFNGVVHRDYIEDQARLLILGCPEPSKEWFLRDKQLGKAESDEAIKEGMRELMIGSGSYRKNSPDIPSLFVYHGSVAGASILQSQVLPPGGIQIGREDLALVGADYYALGHIHYGQQVGDLPAYYAGSAFPVDWGETDQKAFLYATIKKVDDNFIHTVKGPFTHIHPGRRLSSSGRMALPLSRVNTTVMMYGCR
jgi:DNA repair exonuclease SbcCD nuclease subunit